MRCEHRSRCCIGLTHLPLRGLTVDNFHTSTLHGVFETCLPLAALKEVWIPSMMATSSPFANLALDIPQPSWPPPCCRDPTKGIETFLCLSTSASSLLSNIDHDHARLSAVPVEAPEPTPWSRPGAITIAFPACRNHLIHNGHLSTQISFILNAIHDQLVLIAVLRLMLLGTFSHRRKELIGQRLHDQRHLF